MDKGKLLLRSKADDYTSGKTDRYENFGRQAILMSWFKSETDKAFVSLIAVKLARLGSLLDSKSPKHESIEDTFVDLINYCSLWGGYRTINNNANTNSSSIRLEPMIDKSILNKKCSNCLADLGEGEEVYLSNTINGIEPYCSDKCRRAANSF